MPRKVELSGAEKRKRAREKRIGALLEELKALGWCAPAPPPPAFDSSDDGDPGDFAAAFRDAGDPDLDDPGTDLSYVRKLQLIALRQMATTQDPPPQQQALWKRIREMSAVVGMTSNRAALEAEVKRLRAVLEDQRAKLGTAKMVPGASVPLPATARDSGRSRGPRPVPGIDPGAPPREDG